jgi:uncharacterized membrane protein YkoI
MRKRVAKFGAALAALAALAVGGATLASGQEGGSQPQRTPPAAEQEREHGGQVPAYRSSITAPDEEHGSEDAEAQTLRSKATVSAAEARSAALAAVPGTAGEVELDNENGNVVYSVEVKNADGSEIDVKVDAGNAKVLHQEADDGDDAGKAQERESESGTEAEERGR